MAKKPKIQRSEHYDLEKEVDRILEGWEPPKKILKKMDLNWNGLTDRLVRLLELSYTIGGAARKMRLNPNTVYGWIHKGRGVSRGKYHDFAEAVDVAEDRGLDRLEEIHRAAVTQPWDVVVIKEEDNEGVKKVTKETKREKASPRDIREYREYREGMKANRKNARPPSRARAREAADSPLVDPDGTALRFALAGQTNDAIRVTLMMDEESFEGWLDEGWKRSKKITRRMKLDSARAIGAYQRALKSDKVDVDTVEEGRDVSISVVHKPSPEPLKVIVSPPREEKGEDTPAS